LELTVYRGSQETKKTKKTKKLENGAKQAAIKGAALGQSNCWLICWKHQLLNAQTSHDSQKGNKLGPHVRTER
jgi:hypothetical protein